MCVKLMFECIVECDPDYADSLGKDLASWLEESWFNGEDVIEVKFIEHKVIV